jgi:hypothetical protein
MSLPVKLNTIPNQAYLNPSAYLTDFGEPGEALELQTPRKLIYLPLWDINMCDPNYAKGLYPGTPTHYNVDITNQRMWLYPIPNGAIPLVVRYLKNPPEITATSASLFIPSQYHHVVVSGVESLVWQLDEDLQSSQAANTRFENGIQRMIEQDNSGSDYHATISSRAKFIDYSDPFQEF